MCSQCLDSGVSLSSRQRSLHQSRRFPQSFTVFSSLRSLLGLRQQGSLSLKKAGRTTAMVTVHLPVSCQLLPCRQFLNPISSRRDQSRCAERAEEAAHILNSWSPRSGSHHRSAPSQAQPRGPNSGAATHKPRTRRLDRNTSLGVHGYLQLPPGSK